jgi:hypothetical protein
MKAALLALALRIWCATPSLWLRRVASALLASVRAERKGHP